MKTGFIGLGRMGSAMAANLVKAGHDVTVFNRNPEKSRPLHELGAHRATSIADACHGDAVITMLADDTAGSGISVVERCTVGQPPPGAIPITGGPMQRGISQEVAPAALDTGQTL